MTTQGRGLVAPGHQLADELRHRLRKARGGGGPVSSLFLKIADADAAVAVAMSGIDVAILDLEHSQIDPSKVAHISGLLAGYGVPCLVRVAEVNRGEINRFLEAGVAGIQLSTTTSVKQVHDLVAATHYPPKGTRSFSLSHQEALFGTAGRTPYIERTIRGPVLIIQIETATLEDPVESIVGAGADLIFIGTEDLRLTCEAEGLETEVKIEEIRSASTSQEVPWGCYAPIPEVHKRATQGAAFLATGSDLGLLAQTTSSHVKAVSTASQVHSEPGPSSPVARATAFGSIGSRISTS